MGAALLFCIGIAFSGAFSPEFALAFLGVAALLGALAAALSRAAPGMATLLVFLAFAAGGAGAQALHMRTRGAPADDESVWAIEAVVEEPRAIRSGRQTVVVRVDRARLEGQPSWAEVRYRARLSMDPVELWPGDRIKAVARWSPPPREANPGSPGLEARFRADGIGATGFVVEKQLAVLTPPPALARAAERFRERYGRVAGLAVPEPAAQALVRALAVGDRSDLSADVNEDFGASGLAHILSVSGLHIAVVAAGLYRALRWLLSRSERLLLRVDVRAVAALSALPATWLYVWVAGAEVPAVRSGIMASALFLAVALRRDADAPSSLAASLLAVLAYDPASLWAISFQLSFAAVAGLMVLSEPLRTLVPIAKPDLTDESPRGKLRRWGESALGAAVGSLAASLATAPLVAATFHRASLVAVLSNAVALPIASGLTGAAALSAAALPFGESLAAALVCCAEPLARALLFLSHLFGTLPFASALVPAPSLPFQLAWYCGLGGLAMLPFEPKARTRLILPSLLAILLLAGGRFAAPLAQKSLVVTFLAVGQGDSTVLQAPGGEAALIDAGGDPTGRYDPGARVVVPALAELGATHLRAAVLSHPHPDHLMGLVTVLQRVQVDELWMAKGLDHEAPLLARLLEVARERGVRVRELGAGERAALGPCAVEVLHPAARDESLESNDASLVLRVSLGEVAFLLPGDVEELGEEALLAGPSSPRATVLKAPHHGSRTSSTERFVGAVHPQHVVFSVGRNRFGFPREEVVARYLAVGAQVHRTDQSGALRFATDGTSLEVTPTLR
ncbi:MAG TPA: DNA internalization-related competence protein ComEC/Rec2 [Myxococcales bacterium]